VVFSFFKKEPKDSAAPSPKGSASARAAKPVGRPLAAPVNRNAAATQPKSPNTDSVLPDKDLARTLAMETAANRRDRIRNGTRLHAGDRQRADVLEFGGQPDTSTPLPAAGRAAGAGDDIQTR
jgi:hypothetical protein